MLEGNVNAWEQELSNLKRELGAQITQDTKHLAIQLFGC